MPKKKPIGRDKLNDEDIVPCSPCCRVPFILSWLVKEKRYVLVCDKCGGFLKYTHAVIGLTEVRFQSEGRLTIDHRIVPGSNKLN